jgi:CRISPR-associated endonuclease/helicase Cas3
MKYIAHVRELENGQWDTQLLEDHLRETARLAAVFAVEFGSREWGYAMGMAHDVGKATSEWQNGVWIETSLIKDTRKRQSVTLRAGV